MKNKCHNAYNYIVKSGRTKFLIVVFLVICVLSTMMYNIGFSKKYAGSVKVSASSSTIKTIYFDTHGIGTGWNGWTSTGDIYVYIYDDTGANTAIDKKMTISDRENTLFTSDGVLWEIEIDTSKYTHIIFKNLEGWGANNNYTVQTQDIELSGYDDEDYPVFILDGYDTATGKKTAVCKGSLEPLSNAGTSIYFYDMTETNTSVKAVFGGNGLEETTITMNNSVKPYSVVIPDDVDKKPYQTVYFLDENNNMLGEIYNFGGNVSSNEVSIKISKDNCDTFYYGVTEFADDTFNNMWGANRSTITSSSLAGKTLYFDKLFFNIEEGSKIIVDGVEILLTDSYVSSGSYKYDFTSDSTATTTNTTITFVTAEGVKYHFFWDDTSNNLVTIGKSEQAIVSGTYNSSTSISLLFDASLSKLVYGNVANKANGEGDYGIPNSSGTIRYYATGSGMSDIEGNMTLLPAVTINGHTYSDLYRVDLPAGYQNIAFSNFDMSNIYNYGAHGESTTALTIPTDLSMPCFYADTSDDYVYSSSNVQRGGYWDELGNIRDPEKEGSETVVNTVVDIPTGTETHEADKLYLSTTFYDFYTDYELNGNNKDNYGYNSNNGHRIYQPFRQFDQALSDYYTSGNTSSALYWGNFQNYTGSHFSEIATTLDLYGWDDTKKFFYENNSMWGIDGVELGSSTDSTAGQYATMGLVSNTLVDGNLMMTTNDGGVVNAPFFDEEFLSGYNSKNTVLGKIYSSVSFPFNKKALTSNSSPDISGTVDYWYFDSKEADNNLRMTKDSATGEYYLESSSDLVKGTTTDSVTADGNFFPFNSSAQSGIAGTLNYGFGTRIELDFRLTKDGTVINSDGNAVPIEFNFSGDDDIWIFVDGKLALDIGGDHGIVTGYLNFQDLTWYVDRVKDSTTSGYKTDQAGTFTLEGEKTDEHTLTLFYMERGLWESNMYMSFNFPDENYLEIEKEVDESDVNQELFAGLFDGYTFNYDIRNLATHFGTKEVSDSVEEFTGFVMKQYDIPDYGSATSGQLEYPEGAIYTLTKADGTQEDKQLGSTATFSLSHGDVIAFHDQFRRGSYISIHETENILFDTTWTMYENEVPVTSMGEGETVKLGDGGTTTGLVNISSSYVDDGRAEVYQSGLDDGVEISNSGYTSTKKPEENTIVFRSYEFPDSKITSTQLKVVYTNKVKTGSIKITKSNTYDIDVLNDDYTFTITFTNIGGENLETAPITKTITLKNGESQIISGIPINTEYTITETTSDDSKLSGVTEANNKLFSFDGSQSISGIITSDKNTYDYEFVFKNTLKPIISIDITKEWKDLSGNSLTSNIPDSITLQLQRRQGTDEFTAVTDYEIITLTSEQGWITKIENLDKYVDYTQDSLVEWEYRVVEIVTGVVIEAGDINGDFKVSYTKTNKIVDGVETDDLNYIVTNTYIPRTTIKVTKVDATDSNIKLADVEFKLEKLNDDDTIDTSFTTITKLTDSTGVLEFNDLHEGIYRLTETKTQNDYSLLKEPILIVINRSGGDCTINGENCIVDADNKISVMVSNRKKFLLPSTGGNGRTYMIIAGILLIWVAGLIYILKKNDFKTN